MALDVQQQGLQNITVLGWQSEETIPYSLAVADVALNLSLEEFQSWLYQVNSCHLSLLVLQQLY
ncbi:MAG: hypothetical protein R3E31_08550 [Chloroflexota bacterium]